MLDQEETPLLYSLVFGEGVVNDATSVVLFNAILRFDLSHITSSSAIHLLGNFFYLFGASTALGIAVSLSPSHMLCLNGCLMSFYLYFLISVYFGDDNLRLVHQICWQKFSTDEACHFRFYFFLCVSGHH